MIASNTSRIILGYRIRLGLVLGVSWVLYRFGLSVPEPSEWLEKLVPEMTCYVSSGTLNSTHTLTHSTVDVFCYWCIAS